MLTYEELVKTTQTMRERFDELGRELDVLDAERLRKVIERGRMANILAHRERSITEMERLLK